MKKEKKFNVAVLPLSDMVFFPHASISLYLSESRHIQMIRDSIENNQMVALTHIETPFVENRKKKALAKEICSCGFAEILEEGEDGSIKVFLEGKYRVRLLKALQNIPYQIFEASVIEDLYEPRSECHERVEELSNLFHSWCEENIPNSLERENFLESITSFKQVIDYLSMHLISSSEIKQRLLENLSLFERIQLIRVLLTKSESHDEWILCQALKSFENLDSNTRSLAN